MMPVKRKQYFEEIKTTFDISEAIDIYLESINARNLRASTCRNYKDEIRNFVNKQGVTHAEQITYDMVRNYLAAQTPILKDSTVERNRRVLCTWLKFLNTECYIDLPDVTTRIRPLKVDATPPRCLTEEELNKMLEVVEQLPHVDRMLKLRDIALLNVMADTGLRRMELVSMTMDNLDMRQRTITVEASSKSRRSRIVAFTPNTARKLRAYLACRNKNIPFVWCNFYGKRISGGVVKVMIKDVANAAGLTGVHPHTLRHSFATKAIRRKMPITSLQKLLGHGDIQTTMGYLHLAQGEVLEDYDKYFV